MNRKTGLLLSVGMIVVGVGVMLASASQIKKINTKTERFKRAEDHFRISIKLLDDCQPGSEVDKHIEAGEFWMIVAEEF